MNENIENLYNEIYEPKLTPQELIDNLHLPNYESISFSKKGAEIKATVICQMDTGEKALFTYTFDKDNKLMSLIVNRGDKVEKIYDRNTSIKNYYYLAKKNIRRSSKRAL